MPYETKSDHMSQSLIATVGGSATTQAFSSVPHVRTLVRAGSKNNLGYLHSVGRVPGPPKWKTLTVRNGPRLPYKFFNKKTGRFQWARQPIQVTRLVPTTRRAAVDLSKLKPNDLVFQECSIAWRNPKGEIVESRDGTVFSRYDGDICNAFTTRWNTVPVGPELATLTSPGSPPSEATAIAAKLSETCLSSLYEKAKNQKFNLAQFIAERNQTLSMFADGVNRLANTLLYIKRGRLGKAASVLFPGSPKEAANDWLLLQYGIKPFASDLMGSMQMLAIPESQSFDVISKQSEPFSIPSVLHSSVFHGVETKVTITGSVIVKYKARFKIKMETSRLFSRLGLTNPASLAYELTPYSFVLDWLLPIGDYLNNVDAFAGCELESVTKTTFYKWTVVFDRSIVPRNFIGFQWSGPDCGFNANLVNCHREVLSSLPDLPLPSFKSPMSAGHCLNALALLTQIFSKR